MVLPIYKGKGDPMECGSYRGIKLLLQFTVNLKQHPTVRTFMRSTVAVYMTFMSLQVARLTETLVTQ